MQSQETADRLLEATEESTYYYRGIAGVMGEEGLWDFADRYEDFARHVTIEPGETVLDVGCAEGLISMEAAREARRVDAYDISLRRVQAARRIAAERGLTNVTFAHANAATLPVAPQSYDVVLFLGVYHHLNRGDKLAVLTRLLTATRRLLVMRTPLNQKQSPARASNIYNIIEQHNFTVTIHPNRDQLGGNFMLMCAPRN